MRECEAVTGWETLVEVGRGCCEGCSERRERVVRLVILFCFVFARLCVNEVDITITTETFPTCAGRFRVKSERAKKTKFTRRNHTRACYY